MAKVITLAKMPEGIERTIFLSNEQKKFYVDNNATMNMKEICSHLGINNNTMYRLLKIDKDLPKKIPVYHSKKPVITEFFSWENATLIDPIFGLSK